MARSDQSEPIHHGQLSIREATDADSAAVIALIDACFRRYDGCVMDLPGLDCDLPAVATHFARRGGRFWVLEDNSATILGCVGYEPKADGVIELKRLYVDPAARRQGIASRLYAQLREVARARAARAIELWSDTRFNEAHAFYLAHGFRQTGQTRRLNDPSNTTEYQFRLDLPCR